MRDTTYSKNKKAFIGVEFDNSSPAKFVTDGEVNNELAFQAGVLLILNSHPSPIKIDGLIQKLNKAKGVITK
jgi:hypothetical protein